MLWAHELTHVKQYQDWGIGDFASRYLRSHHEVEREAYEAETRYMAWAAVRNSQSSTNDSAINRPVEAFSGVGTSDLCGSWMGPCPVGGSAPVGTPCWCNTVMGPSAGALIPAAAARQSTNQLTGTDKLVVVLFGPANSRPVPASNCEFLVVSIMGTKPENVNQSTAAKINEASLVGRTVMVSSARKAVSRA